MSKVKVENSCSFGLAWFGGWLFTLGYLQLTFWHCVWAVVVWPYYLGSFFAG